VSVRRPTFRTLLVVLIWLAVCLAWATYYWVGGASINMALGVSIGAPIATGLALAGATRATSHD